MVGLRDVLVVAPAAYHHHHHHHDHQLLPSAAEHSVIPLLSAAPCLADDSHAKPPTGIQFWQPQPASSNPNPNSSTLSYLRKPVPALDAAAAAAAALAGGGASTCQDCGNQAKKDCSHRRCRTCCKSRGFDCSTHVKSTWVPAARRRERQLSSSAAGAANPPPAAGSSASTSAQKKPRLLSSTTTSHTSTSNTPPRSFDTSSSHQDASFRESLPGHVRAPAVFKCVRVTSIDDGEDEYAYQAMVRIGGHVFKGFLYDQGLDDPDNPANNGNAIPNISELHLGGGGGGGSGPSDVYGTAAGGGSGGLLGGATTFGNPIN